MEQTNETTKCPVLMVFHAGHCEQILFTNWVTKRPDQLIYSAIIFFAMGFLFEFVNFTRDYISKNTRSNLVGTIVLKQKIMPPSCNDANSTCTTKRYPLDPNNKKFFNLVVNKHHFLQTFLYTLQLLMTYILMLVVMNFNYWLMLAIVLGLGAGYFCFGWIRKDIFGTDCCS